MRRLRKPNIQLMELMNEGLRGLGHMTGPVFSAEHFQYKEVCLNVRSLKKNPTTTTEPE